jgi:ligand-binding sensor domain-containing protein
MAFKKFLFLCCSLILFSLCLRSQQSKTYAFTHYKISDGLASNIVYNVVQDDNGFIWLSTINGLQRFDGNKFTTFKSDPSQHHSLPTDEINHVYVDRTKKLWVLTNDNKVGTFNTTTFRYQEVPVQSLNNGNVYAQKTFLETSDGKLLLYINYTNKLFEFSPAGKAFVPSTYLRIPDKWRFNMVVQDKVNKKFIITTDSGFVVYNPATKNLSYANHNQENEHLIEENAKSQYLNYQYLDASRRLFYEHWPKNIVHPVLKVYDLKTDTQQTYDLTKEHQIGYHLFTGILQQQTGKIWICGLPFLAEFTDGALPFQFIKKDYNKEKDLKFNRAYSMYEDRQQNVWVSTDYGLYLFNPVAQLFQSYTLNNPKRNQVEGRAQTALQLNNGEIWIGYRDLGLYRYDKNLNPLPLPASIEPLQNMKSVWDIHQHSQTGNIWIALQGGQLIVYDTALQRAKLLTPPPFENRAITQIAEDKLGNLWFGTQPGNIVKWDWRKAATNIEEGFSLITKTGIINKIFIDSKSYVWVCGYGDGVLKIYPRTNQVLTRISKSSPKGYNLWNNAPNDIIQYNDSLLLVASGALNLINVNNNQVKQITTRDGLPTNTVSSLIRDQSGVLWLGTLNGLCRADLNTLSFVVYDQNDGLPNEDFNVAGAFALQDGRLLFTSVESFVVFDPMRTRRNVTAAKAVITDFKLSNSSLRLDSLLALKEVDLDHDQNSVVFEFSALNFSRQNKIDYYYKLENFDTAWIKSEARHQATYNFLPPGSYRFLVKTKNIDGIFSNGVSSLKLTVHPPFWQTWWFYLLIVLLVILVLYLIDRERMRRLASLHNVRSEIASHLHMDVSTTLNNINVLSQIAKMKADRDIMRSKELIDEISDKSYNMVVNMDEILWSIDPSNDTMEKTLLRLFEYAQTLETNYDTAIDIVVHEKVKDLRLDMKVRHDFFIVCKETLQRLVHQSNHKSILVDIDLVRSKIVLKILSLEADTSTHTTELAELKELLAKKATDLHASLAFELGKKETSIVLSIPLK